MRMYISTHTPPESREKALSDFDELILISKCQSKRYRYPTIKKWFLNKYPEVKGFQFLPVKSAEFETSEIIECEKEAA